MIRVEQLTKGYADNPVLRGIDLQVQAGEFVVILGQSGAGKSTLLRCMNRLAKADGGRLELAGVDAMCARDQRELRRRVAMIFQHHNVVPRLSVLKNVLTGRLGHSATLPSLLQLFSRDDVALAHDCLRRVALEHKAEARTDALSGGQMQRVGIARALAQRPQVILADEPVASLDPQTAHRVMHYLREATHTLGITVVCNLHQVELARKFGDRIVGLASGRLVFDGRPDQLDDAALRRIYPDTPASEPPAPMAVARPPLATGTGA
ncbi:MULTISPECIES: phosphonate ABC transporter ATP-binding protein [unclassified Pseudomonas]|uniref:phosphonate ABC transporter ATP-binding protein n=1 Tax=unclassified Pseudomonas TaxID=196821 RepID=UPI00244774FF|nr:MULTISPECIES: phosphonate ABC transporter ATP-binding protein [unclassified Pseudomonas]MDH0300971.1 phosphonate ABC transporter ATP-binding protein [Pseudomonas sp. GD04091]MDH1983497.1 phosphonate ABC transporter ATP-binding protein [Pseudomonas sp. GD03689]